MALPSGLQVADADERLMRYCEEEYRYYDGIPSTPTRSRPSMWW
jgi:hypothetical protein